MCKINDPVSKDVSYVHMAPCIVRGRVGKGKESGEANVDFVSIVLIVGGDCSTSGRSKIECIFGGGLNSE